MIKKSKILIVSAVFPPEPVVSASLSRDIAETLSNRRNVTVICPKPSRPEGFNFEERLNSNEYDIVEINSYTCASSRIIGRLKESYSFGKCCEKYIIKNKNIIKCIYINSWPLLSQYFIIKVAKKYNIKCVIHIQDIYPESLINKIPFGKSIIYKILLPLDKFSLRNSNSIIAISDNMKQTLIRTRGILSDNIHVIPNWQDEQEFISFKKLNLLKKDAVSNDFIFMYLGNNGPLAGVEFVIKCFFKANISNSKLIIAGSGSRKNRCIELVNTLNASNIDFLEVQKGMVPNTQDKADILLLPVKKNGAMSSIPSKLPAYMFSSKPILGSIDLNSDTAKAIINSGCGIVVEPENEFEIITAMKNMATWSKTTREEKGKAGFEYAMKNFSKKINLAKLIHVIESTIE